MKKLLFVCIILLGIFSCEILCDDSTPGAPYGTPDDTSVYIGSDGYKSITYTYYCKNGKYISVDYTRIDACSYYKKSEYTSSGICK